MQELSADDVRASQPPNFCGFALCVQVTYPFGRKTKVTSLSPSLGYVIAVHTPECLLSSGLYGLCVKQLRG